MGSASPAIGIDLGTTYSCVALFKNGQVEIIANANGERKTPNYVAFTEEVRLIGQAAKDNLGLNPKNTVFDIKRIIGRKASDKALRKHIPNWPFKIVSKDGKPNVQVNFRNDQKVLSAEEISSMILKHMKDIAEAYHGSEIKKAVVTVPAYFNDAQRQATKNAARIAGLEILRIVNDPTAAAIAYGFMKKDLSSETVLILDLGGGTFDVSILTIHNGVYTVKATAGDTELGGENFDINVVNYFLAEIKRKHKKDLRENTKAIYRLRTACEKAKRNLSVNSQASIVVDNLYEETDFKSTLTKARFEQINAELFEKLRPPIMKVLSDAEMGGDQIDSIVLVGGHSRISYLHRLIDEIFPGKGFDKRIDPDEAVGYGAAILAAHLNGDEHERLKHFQLRDVTPLSLGIEVIGGQMEVVIGRNSPIPASNTKTFTTNFDNQFAVHIVVYEGERPLVKDNNKLGEFFIEGIAPAQREIPKIVVTFDIDRDGILSVSAVDKRSQKTESKMTIQNDKGRLSEPEIWKMIKEAEKFKDYDKERHAKVKEELELEEYCMEAKSVVSNFKDIISSTEIIFVQNKCDECLQWLHINHEDRNLDAIEKKMLQLKLDCNTILDKCCQ